MRAKPLGGSKNPIMPYAIRVDIPRHAVREITTAAEKPDAPYYLKTLANVLNEALAPYKR